MILDLFRSHQWWILQIVGSVGVYFALIPGKKYGLCWRSYLTYLFFASTICGWTFLKSYETAPSFFQPWFVGTALLALIGYLGSIFYFKESTCALYNFGAIITLIGACMLIWPKK